MASAGQFQTACTDDVQLGRYLQYNVETKQFSATDYASSLTTADAPSTFEDSSSEKITMKDEPGSDAVLVDV